MEAPHKGSLIGQPIGKYRINRLLGHGTVGEVYEVVQDSIGYRAAVKILSAELAKDPGHQQYVSRFIDEARAVNFINDPGIVRIFDLGELADHSLFILMEYLDGQTLAERLRAAPSSRLDVRDALRITRQISSVMAHVHGKGVLHRDLNPDNVILIADSEAPGKQRTKLIDFGLAKFLDSPERRTSLGLALGTPTYMAPEQCLGSEALDGRADVYSLGIMLYEMLAGQTPFAGTQKAVMHGHINETPRPLRELVPGLSATVYQLADDLLAKAIAQRPEMAQVEARITEIEADLARPVATPVAAPQPAGRGQLWTGMAVGALLVLFINCGLWWGARGSIVRSVCPPSAAAPMAERPHAAPAASRAAVEPTSGDGSPGEAGAAARPAAAAKDSEASGSAAPDEAVHKLHKPPIHKPKPH